MNKKIALITLIDASLVLSTDEKLRLIEVVPSFTVEQVDILGNFLQKERDVVLDNETEIMENIRKNLEKVQILDQNDTVFVGTGRP